MTENEWLMLACATTALVLIGLSLALMYFRVNEIHWNLKLVLKKMGDEYSPDDSNHTNKGTHQ